MSEWLFVISQKQALENNLQTLRHKRRTLQVLDHSIIDEYHQTSFTEKLNNAHKQIQNHSQLSFPQSKKNYSPQSELEFVLMVQSLSEKLYTEAINNGVEAPNGNYLRFLGFENYAQADTYTNHTLQDKLHEIEALEHLLRLLFETNLTQLTKVTSGIKDPHGFKHSFDFTGQTETLRQFVNAITQSPFPIYIDSIEVFQKQDFENQTQQTDQRHFSVTVQWEPNEIYKLSKEARS